MVLYEEGRAEGVEVEDFGPFLCMGRYLLGRHHGSMPGKERERVKTKRNVHKEDP